MDLLCTNCGEPWDLYHVLHDAEPEDFERDGAVIRRCPCCEANKPETLPKRVRERLQDLAAAGELFGDDVDGFAAFLDDVKFMDFD